MDGSSRQTVEVLAMQVCSSRRESRLVLPRCDSGARDHVAQRTPDGQLSFRTCVLVDQRSARRRMTHARHQFASRCTGRSGERVASVAKVVKVQSVELERAYDLGPLH